MSTDNRNEEKNLMLKEVLHGLSQPQKVLPSKYFYDHDGSELFHQITLLDEYYPTRTEMQIMEDNIDEIVETLGRQVLLIEPGSGNSTKTRLLLNNLKKLSGYMPLDISAEFLFKSADQLQEEYPKLAIIPLQVDYTHPFELPEFPSYCRRVVFFPGSTIGNFKHDTVSEFLAVIHDIIEEDGGFLIGVDLIKDIAVLEAAYNDSKGITAAFNKNILKHINDELACSFDTSKFDHYAFFNEDKNRIEMHLKCVEDHSIQMNGDVISFKKGETIHTENSHKYSLDLLKELVDPWFDIKKFWTDENEYFGLIYLTPK